ncbi:MAG: 4-hydroxy-tetrahydrodipicolinate reductase [Pseudomonadota bacterium]
MTAPLRIALLGASGRMGQALAALIEENAELTVSGSWSRDAASLAGALAGADVAIDFTDGETVAVVAAATVRAGVPLVTGTTGLTADAEAALASAAQQIPVLQDGNMSLGIHVMTFLVQQAAARLPGYDIEISETHHRDKRDAPSGTALKLGAAITSARSLDATPKARIGADQLRGDGEIGYAVTRGGSVIGEHSVAFLGDHDRLEIHHAASDRRLFAAGALAAARWLVDQQAGHYSMAALFAVT